MTTTRIRLYPQRSAAEVAAELERLTATTEPWPTEPWEQYGRTIDRAGMRAHAARMMHDHGHGGHWDPMTRENCSACCLGGYRPRGGWGDPEADAIDAGPNVAGWARDYVEAGRPVKLRWVGALLADASDDPEVQDNQAYAEALRRSLATWGVSFDDGTSWRRS
jgi:hypothetical protein